MGKRHGNFRKIGTQMLNKHIKRYLTSFVTSKMQIKITVLYHYILTRMAEMKKNVIVNVKDCKRTNLENYLAV